MRSLNLLWFILLVLYGFTQLAAATLWTAEYGILWTIALYLVVFFFRFTLPVTVCAFFGAMEIFGWHWTLALIFAAPGIIFMFTSIILALVEDIKPPKKSNN